MQAIVHTPAAWCADALVMLLTSLALVYRLLAERQRMVTFERIFTNAPGGTVVVQEKSVAGPAIWIWVGEAPKPPRITSSGSSGCRGPVW